MKYCLFYSFSQSLVSKLPPSPYIFTELKLASYYDNNAVPKDLNFQKDILAILESLHPSKVADIDKFLGKFLRDEIYQLCNLSNKLSYFQRGCQIAKVKPLFKKRSKTDPQNDHAISLLP